LGLFWTAAKSKAAKLIVLRFAADHLSALGNKNKRYQRLGDSGDALICFRRSPIETPVAVE
jgi:hypothetical protein